MKRLLLASGVVVGLSCPLMQAQTVPSVVVGNDILLPNWPTGQAIQIPVTGGQAVNGMDLNTEIADGGPANGGVVGPVFTGADLITGTIFSGNHLAQQDSTAFGKQIYAGSIITSSGTVTASGTLATLTLSTVGVNPGIYSLKLARFINGGVNGDTDLGIDSNSNPVYPNVTNGNLVVLYPGDTNKDGTVDLNDLLTLTRNMGKAGTWATGDTNGDGTVNLADFLNLTRNFGKSINLNPAAPAISAAALSPQVAVPEPATAGLLAAAALALCRRSRRVA